MQIPFRGSGKVYYSDKEYACALYYSKDGGSVVVKVIKHTKSGIGNYLELPLEIEVLSGKLESGYQFTLLELQRAETKDNISSKVSEYVYYAEYMLSGIKKETKNKQTFSRVDFVISDIVKWGEESVYRIGENYELSYKDAPVCKTLYSGKGCLIQYIVQGSMLPVLDSDLYCEHIDLEQYGIIEISYSEEHDFKDFINLFDKINSLLEVSLLSPVSVKKVYAFSKEFQDNYGETLIERKINIYGRIIGTDSDSESSERPMRFKWITLPKLIDNNSFEIYLNKQEIIKPIIELYVEVINFRRPSVTNVFLNLVQALETYHSRFVTNDLKVFKKRVESLTKGLSQSNSDQIKDFLMANSKQFITLESRLADLLFANGLVYFDTGDIKHIDFPAVIARTRNYYIHYDESLKVNNRIMNPDELSIYNAVLFQILEYYILSELGFPFEDIERIIRTRWENVSMSLSILKASRSKTEKS